jgi:rhamnose utilization protein RhaD (predicted bifunctional aldolase and dehydrogenase)/NAD(P)-dependent dehydrogenase (short-subunit alcohol dehydrogenase family)
MQNSWSDRDADQFGVDPLSRRVYTSRLLGREASLVLHGGGNTSVKAPFRDIFGEAVDVLYVKGSGWDLATIEPAGFAPVRMDALLKLGELDSISDTMLVRAQRSALMDPTAPDPSVEAVLHALIPFAFVDHTHADAVVAVTNTPDGAGRVPELFGPRLLVVPYVMPGFHLARQVRRLTRGIDWSAYDGMILMNHGIFTWGETARASYDAMIRLVTVAERHLDAHGALSAARRGEAGSVDLTALARARRAVSRVAAKAMVARSASTAEARGFASRDDLDAIATRGPLTPDHIIRTKRIPVLLGDDADDAVDGFASAYRDYFQRHTDGKLRMLDPAPRWGVFPGVGVVSFGRTPRDAGIVADIVDHTVAVVQWAEALGGWRALPERDLFDVEYWELEQAKLGKQGSGRMLDGRVAFVTGAASGIGKAVVEELVLQGAAVVGVDIATSGDGGSTALNPVNLVCDITDEAAVSRAVDETVRRFGGLDILVSNAGVFPISQRIDEMDAATWDRTLAINLTGHQRVLQACIPYLRLGYEPAVVVIGSKNVPAPGPGQAAYSVSKAGLSQLARVAALELASDRIRVNVIHPNAVFDTGVWTPEVLASRAAAYGMTIEEYKRSNLLGVEITSRDVARMVVAVAGPVFGRTTGAQIPIDGGNDRVI